VEEAGEQVSASSSSSSAGLTVAASCVMRCQPSCVVVVGFRHLLQEQADGGLRAGGGEQARRLLLGLLQVMLENRRDAVADHRHEALIGLAGGRQVEAHHQLAALMAPSRVRHRRRQDDRIAARHAAHLQLLVAIHDQQLDRAVAAQLQGQAAGLLELAGDQRGDGGRFAEQLGDGRLVVAVDLHLLPGIAEMDDGTANIEAFEQEAADVLRSFQLPRSFPGEADQQTGCRYRAPGA
jgi:hypothetical protein